MTHSTIKEKRRKNARNNRNSINSSVDSGSGYLECHGRFYSYSFGHCSHYDFSPPHSRPQTIMAVINKKKKTVNTKEVR